MTNAHLKTARVAAFAVAAALAGPTTASAGGTRTFQIDDFGEFDAGEAEGAAIESNGRVSVGFATSRAKVDGAMSFVCVGRDSDALIGTADEASIQRVTFKGKGKKGNEPQIESIAKLDGVVVTAIAPLPGGDIVAATLPGGTLHRVTPRGKVSEFAKLDVEQVWALLVHDGKLYVGTGPKGELFSMSLSGKDPKVVLDVGEKHVLSLLSIGGHVIAGTSKGAKLYQVTDKTDGVLIHEFAGGDEVRALAATRTGLVVAVNEFEDRKLSSVDALTKALARTSLAGQPPTGDLGETRGPKADAKLYHVDLGKGRDLARASEATWEEWLDRDDQYFTSLLALDDVGTVLVGSSSGGKIYRTRGPRNSSTIADLEEKQATSLCRIGKGPIVATAGHGSAAYRLLGASADTARYRTKVLDAKQPAQYGALSIQAKGPIKARARFGPTKDPDDKRWGKWTPVELTRNKGELRGTLAKMAKRRYVQLELELESPDAEVRAIELFYAPENLAPLLSEVELNRPDFDKDDDDEPSSNVTIKWKADARDEDDLVYDVRVRPEGSGDAGWIILSDDDELLTKGELKWDLTTVPDGVYEIEVKASDAPSNGDASAASDAIVSAPFVVDRQRPSVSDVKVAAGKVTATARDEGGYVHDVSYSIDGGPFRPASADDGMFDEPEEKVTGVVPSDLRKGKHRLVVRARDSFGNIASSAAFF
jgi:hypothetical protein